MCKIYKLIAAMTIRNEKHVIECYIYKIVKFTNKLVKLPIPALRIILIDGITCENSFDEALTQEGKNNIL